MNRVWKLVTTPHRPVQIDQKVIAPKISQRRLTRSASRPAGRPAKP